jgi:pyridoxine 5-phosphate synthase
VLTPTLQAKHALLNSNVAPIAQIAEIVELNIGHSIVARALFVGLPAAVAEMRRAMNEARNAK